MGISHRGRSATRDAGFFDEWTRENAAARTPVDRRPAAASTDGNPGPKSTRRLRRAPTIAGMAVLAVGASVLMPSTSASADPSSHTWYRLRMCESSDNYSINTGNNHYGAYQFDLSTWQSVGGSGYPNKASKAEQDARALILYRERGWQPWQCAGILGLHEDSDAGTGYIKDIKISAGGSTGSSGHHSSGHHSSGHHSPTSGTSSDGVPAFPGGSHWYTYGEWNSHIKQFQDQMHKRGFFPVGTGQYGPNTLRMVEQLQRLNGLVPNGYIGPNTWRTAWKGNYHEPSGTSSSHSSGKPSSSSSSKSAPTFPGGSHWYGYGERNSHIKQFQDQMHKRGFFPVGTGEYGPNTYRMVKQLQRLNGLVPNGWIGPHTWALAWTGKYSMPS